MLFLKHLQQRLRHSVQYNTQCVLCEGSCIIGQKQHIASNTGQYTIPNLCMDCAYDLPYYDVLHCPQCALPTTAGEHCGRCLQYPPAFDRTYAVFKYAYPLEGVLHQYKYQQQLHLAHILTALILQSHIQTFLAMENVDAVVAMPMHHNRLRERGFNHMHTLVQALNNSWQRPMPMNACRRIKDTPTQAGLNLKQRITNLKGAFETKQRWHGKHILLVDDVMTTGSSLNALAKVFRSAGASQVSCLVIARTLKQK